MKCNKIKYVKKNARVSLSFTLSLPLCLLFEASWSSFFCCFLRPRLDSSWLEVLALVGEWLFKCYFMYFIVFRSPQIIFFPFSNFFGQIYNLQSCFSWIFSVLTSSLFLEKDLLIPNSYLGLLSVFSPIS